MAHFAQLDQNNIVTNVIVVNNENLLDENNQEQESIGIEYICDVLKDNSKWVQTSYNNSFRVRYAGLGFSYDENLDAFIPPKPFESWILDTETLDWKAPLDEPQTLTEEQQNDGYYYRWDENQYQQDNTTGWVLDILN